MKLMILIDDREPEDLTRYMRQYDVEVERAHLDFGDCMFYGNGSTGSLFIGIERKRITDLIDSMKSRRLRGHQLKGMFDCYDILYLVIEGLWRPTSGGAIEHFAGNHWQPLYHQSEGVSYRQVDAFVDSITLDGVHVWRTYSLQETAQFYVSRYQHWQKPWEQHRSERLIYTRDPRVQTGKGNWLTRKPGPVAKVAAQFPGIDTKAWECERFFPDVFSMVTASKKSWMEIDGIGPKTAEEVWGWLRGRVERVKGENNESSEGE